MKSVKMTFSLDPLIDRTLNVAKLL